MIECLVTSQRAINAINSCLVDARPIAIYFIPFDPSFDTRNEYRCFSCPVSPICPAPKVTAISQYRWTERGRHRPSEKFTTFLLQRIQQLHHEILDYAKMWDPETSDGLRDQGFVFDVRYLAGLEVQLIELNEFGIAGRCGSALFHWLTDAEVLYGGREEVELRLVARKTKRERVRAWRWTSYLGTLFRGGAHD